jgi:hypothetical protein
MLDFLLISDFNLSNLAALLSKDEESPMIHAVTAPFGQVMQRKQLEIGAVLADEMINDGQGLSAIRNCSEPLAKSRADARLVA